MSGYSPAATNGNAQAYPGVNHKDACSESSKSSAQTGQDGEIRKLLAIAYPATAEQDDAVKCVQDLVDQYIERTYPAGNPDEHTKIVRAIVRAFREDVRSGRLQNVDIDAIRKCVQDEISKAEERGRKASINIHASYDDLCSAINWGVVEWIIRKKNWGIEDEDVEDIMQEIKIELWFRWRDGAFIDASKASAFANTVARNKAVDLVRKTLTHRTISADTPVSDNPDALSIIETIPDEREHDQSIIITKDCILDLAENMKFDNERHREAWNMHYFQDVSNTDIAKEMGVEQGTVSKWLAKCRIMLRDRYEKEGR